MCVCKKLFVVQRLKYKDDGCTYGYISTLAIMFSPQILLVVNGGSWPSLTVIHGFHSLWRYKHERPNLAKLLASGFIFLNAYISQ